MCDFLPGEAEASEIVVVLKMLGCILLARKVENEQREKTKRFREIQGDILNYELVEKARYLVDRKTLKQTTHDDGSP